MMKANIYFQFDEMKFPIINIENELVINMFPITKIQFERCLARPGGFSNKLYESIVSISPRISWRSVNVNNYEYIFLTGIFPHEALEFARNYGEGYDLPEADEWKYAAKKLNIIKLSDVKIINHELISLIKKFKNCNTLMELCLFREGIFEWVKYGNGYALLGKPRQCVFPNTFNPIIDEPIKLLKEERVPYVGFRLIKRQKNIKKCQF